MSAQSLLLWLPADYVNNMKLNDDHSHEHPTFEGVSIRSRNGDDQSRKGTVGSMIKRLRQATNEYPLPPPG